MEKSRCRWKTHEIYLFSILTSSVDMNKVILGEKEYDLWTVKIDFLSYKCWNICALNLF